MKTKNVFSTPVFRISALCLSFCIFTSLVFAIVPEETAKQEATYPSGLFPASSWTQEKTYADKISHKLGFGFLNITAGWTAFFYEPSRDKNFFAGVGLGTLYLFTNTLGGVLHAATFPVPVDIPLPHGGISYEYNR